ncbi:MAG: hypothetical protein SCH98_00245 [Deferrisomatales bacterium]|nr:hypothetical protein [Deferrisomatales bacterium]
MTEQLLLAQLTTAILLLASPVVLRRGLPSPSPFAKLVSGLFRALRPERRPRRVRRVAMRGARPWWE